MTRLGAILVLLGALSGFLAPVRADEPADGKGKAKNKKKHEKSNVESLIVIQGPDGKTRKFTNADDPELQKLLRDLPAGISFGGKGGKDGDESNGFSIELGGDDENAEACEECADDEACEKCEDDEADDERPAGKHHAATHSETRIVVQGPDGKRHEWSSRGAGKLPDMLKGLPFKMPGEATFDFSFGDDDGKDGAHEGKGALPRFLQRFFPGKGGQSERAWTVPAPPIFPTGASSDGALDERLDQLEKRLERIEKLLKKLVNRDEVI